LGEPTDKPKSLQKTRKNSKNTTREKKMEGLWTQLKGKKTPDKYGGGEIDKEGREGTAKSC